MHAWPCKLARAAICKDLEDALWKIPLKLIFGASLLRTREIVKVENDILSVKGGITAVKRRPRRFGNKNSYHSREWRNRIDLEIFLFGK
jgi:hypothetical protein